MNPDNKQKTWEEKFDEEFCLVSFAGYHYSGEEKTELVFNQNAEPEEIKDFISSQISLAEERGKNEALDVVEKEMTKIEDLLCGEYDCYKNVWEAIDRAEAKLR